MPDAQLSILIVEDDKPFATQTADYLTARGIKTDCAHDAEQFRSIFSKGGYDLILLDVMLGKDDGLTLCKEVRHASSVPIIFISALGEDSDIIVGLELGADDYLVKPFSPRQLLARIKSVMRRCGSAKSESISESDAQERRYICFKDWRLDTKTCMLIDPAGSGTTLSYALYQILRYLLDHPYVNISREDLIRCIKSGEDEDALMHRLDSHIFRLRLCLGDTGAEQQYIKTVRNIGYRFVAENIRWE